MIYFDNAATTGHKPAAVIKAVDNALLSLSANPGRSGHRLSERAAFALFSARERAAEFFGANGAECVAFTANCTHSLNMVIKGVLKSGDHVITSDLEHNAVIRPLYKCGAEADAAQVSFADDDQTAENFKRLIRPNTKMIICTTASNVLGKCVPIEKIGRLCKENGILFAVDAAQTAGVIPINMQKMNIDYLCIAPHKGLYAPMGIGILIAHSPLEHTVIEGGTGTESINPAQPEAMPERLESGTVNLPAVMGVKAGIDFVRSRGMANIYRHEMAITAMLYDAMVRMNNIQLYTPRPEMSGFAPVLSFNVKGLSSDKTAAVLDKYGIAVRAGLHCAPSAHRRIETLETGTVRVCPSVFNTKNEADYLLKTLKKIKS